MTDLELLEELKRIDTPTITNVVAVYSGRPNCLEIYNPWTENWYTDNSLRCWYPELGPIAGYAVTCTYGLPDPSYKGRSLLDVLEAMDKLGKPSIFCFQQKFPAGIADWLNDKIPMLGSRTPLEAVKDPSGQEAVAALVTQIERDGAKMKPPLDPQIVLRLRERLQLA